MKRSPLKRGKPLQRRAQLHATPPARAERVRELPPAYVLTRTPNYARCTVSLPLPKEAPVRSEAYRRLVASLPCIHCGIEGFTQAAHGNTGKGAGIKTDDRFAFPLCAARPGEVGCHARFDQGALFSKLVRREVEVEWARRTVQFLIGAGRWPAGLPVPDWAAA